MKSDSTYLDDLLPAEQVALANLQAVCARPLAKRIKALLLLGPTGSGKSTVLRAFAETVPGAQMLLSVDLIAERPPAADPSYVRDWWQKLLEASRKGIVVVDGLDLFSSIVSPDWTIDLIKRAEQIPLRNFVILGLSVGEARLLPSARKIKQFVEGDRIVELNVSLQDRISLAQRFGTTVTGDDLYHARFRRDS